MALMGSTSLQWIKGACVIRAADSPHIGMHPTADTLLVIYFQRLGAAGDAWRYTAFYER